MSSYVAGLESVDHQQLYASFNVLNSKKDDDVYGKLSQTLPLPSLPDHLILTADNLDQRIRQAEKTAVVFYLGCECVCLSIVVE